MSVDSSPNAGLVGGVEVEVTGYLTARAGTHGAHVSIGPNTTVADVVETLSERYGDQVEPALLSDDRLRSDTVALRRRMGHEERVYAGSELTSGDTLRFETFE